MKAKQRYDVLQSDRQQFLDKAWEASQLTLPYLIRRDDEYTKGNKVLKTPWQSVGAKGVVTLASKLMLALLPPQTTFFKLQIDESGIPPGLFEKNPSVKTEMDTSFAKIERTIMESIAASDDRVVVHQALKHLVVAGNALIFMNKNQLKLYPLNRYVVERDGNGNVVEIITKETVSKKLVEKFLPDYEPNHVANEYDTNPGECDIYTHVKRDNNRVTWYQEVYGKVIPSSYGKSPLDKNPWLPLRFNYVDGEAYGRGRVEEFMGDLKSLESLSQALVEGSAAAAKVVFVVSPSSTTKPATLAAAGNGAIVQGRPDDIGVVQVGKTADFRTAFEQSQVFQKRLSEAFLVMNVRDSERTTAEEVRMTQQELESQLGGLFSLLTVEFLVPYLSRKLDQLQKSRAIPKLPNDLVRPTIVAGINALGRGADRESLSEFLQTLSQSMGPEALQTYINPEEVIRRLAGSMGIDQLGLVKGMDQVKSERQEQMQQQASMDQDLALTKQAAQLQQLPNDPSQTSPPTEEGGNQLPTQAGPEGGQPPAPGGVAGG
jgi:hypothetical protein